MRKFLLGLSVFMVLLTTTIYAFPFSFDFEESIELNSERVNDRIKAFEDSDGNWWVTYIKNSDKKFYVEKFNDQFSSQASYTDNNICHDASYCEHADSTYYIDGSGNEIIRIVTLEDDSKPRLTITDFDLATTTFTEIVQGGDGVSNYEGDRVAIDISGYQHEDILNPLDDEILLGWYQDVLGTVTWRYSNSDSIGNSINGDGQLDFYGDYNPPTDSQIAWCNDHYYIGAFNDTTNSLFIHSFEINSITADIDFIGTTYGLTSGGIYDMEDADWSLYAETTESGTDILHMIALDRTTKEVWFLAWECQDTGQLSNIHTIHNDYSALISDDFDYSGNNARAKYGMEDLSSPIQDSINNNDGVYNGVLYSINGVNDNSIGFDGVNDFINVTDDNTLDISDNTMSVDFWVKLDNIPGSGVSYQIYDKRSGTTGYEAWLTYVTPTTTRLYCQFDYGTSNDILTLVNDTWYHMACVYNGTHVVSYLNGVANTGAGAYSTAMTPNTNNLYIGSIYGAGSKFLKGTIDELVIYGDALTPAGVDERYDMFSSTDIITKPFLTKDSDGVFRAFYQEKEGSSYSIQTLGNFGDCACNDWVAQDVCEYDQQKFTRTCSPSDCETNITYWAETTYCSKKYNESVGIYPQKFETWIGKDSCLTDFVDLDTVATCEMIKDIPVACLNITTEISALPVFDAVSDKCDEGFYTLIACSPTYDCVSQEFLCNEFNGSLSKNTTEFIAGEVANGRVSMTVQSSCKCPIAFGLGTLGIKKFQLNGVLEVQCVVPYENEWFCMDDNYKGYRQLDGSITNKTYCDNGCYEGECLGDGETPTDESGNVRGTGAFVNFINFFKNPTPVQKMITALIGIILSGIIVVGITVGIGMKSDLHIPLLLGTATAFVLFTFLGYIPVVFVVVLVFFVGIGFLLKNK